MIKLLSETRNAIEKVREALNRSYLKRKTDLIEKASLKLLNAYFGGGNSWKEYSETVGGEIEEPSRTQS